METVKFFSSVGYQCLEQLEQTSVDLYLSTCGIQSCNPNHYFGPAKRDIYLIHFVSEGAGTYMANGKKYNLRKGDFFVIYPDTEVYYVSDDKKPWEYMWIGFGGIKAESYLKYAGIDRENLTGVYNNLSFILANIQQMMLARTLTYYNEMKRQSYLLQILAALVEDYQQNLPSEETYIYPNKVYLQQAFDYIKQHISEDVKIAEIADYIGINRSYLTSIFKKNLGVSPQEYLINVRMDMAEDLLRNTDYKISYISSLVGYNDPLTFSKMYKKYKGKSPSQTQKI